MLVLMMNMIEGECAGGIGVSGGDWQQDQDVATAAVDAVGATTM